MEGSCDLTFKPDCTVMTLKCKTEMFIDDEVSAQFELPQNCIVAFIDNTDGELGSISGSGIIQTLRHHLRDTDNSEANLFTLVRSGNDSASDEEKYLSRAHGALSKSVTNKAQLKKALAAHWYGRFGNTISHQQDVAASDFGASFGWDKETAVMVVEDIDSTLSKLQIIADGADIEWPSLWRTLHQVKGNCLGLQDCLERPVLSESSIQVCQTISSMRGPKPPEFVQLTKVLPMELKLIRKEIQQCWKLSA